MHAFKKSKLDAESSFICKKSFESPVLELWRQPDKSVLDFLSSTPDFPSASLDKLGIKFSPIFQLLISQLMQLFLSERCIGFEN
jgi:hypothetical protein